MKKYSLYLIFLLQVHSVTAAVYDTLPTGINTVVAKQIKASKIDSRYGADNQSSGLSIKQEFKSANLENISDAVNTYFKELQAISPDAYNQFSLGEFQAHAWAEVNVQGFGIGHGITDHLTILASVPVYHIKSQVDFTQSKKSNLALIKSSLEKISTTTATSNFVRELTLQLPDTNEQLLQSLMVNFYGYKPLGHFERDALGDAEIGMIYRLTDLNNQGQAIGFGAVLPTGKIDDPDSLQDISTGDGQYDAYLETLSGASFLNHTFQLDLKFRYTYQFETKKRLRMISDQSLPLSRETKLVTEKLGNKIDSTLTATINPTIWFNVNTSFIINKVEASQYSIAETSTKAAMEANTNSLSQWGRIGVGFSSVELYKNKKLDIPFEVNLSYQRIIKAQNSPDFERVDADVRLYF